jgi:ATP-binding cassette subfamily B protein
MRREAEFAKARVDELLLSQTDHGVAPRPARNRPSGRINVTALAYRYRADQAPVFKDISFDVAAGQKCVILGPAGAGKSTLARVLAGLLPPASGTVLLDGTSIEEFKGAELRLYLGYVGHDVRLVEGTIRQNIALGSSVDLDEIIRAASIVGFDGDVGKMPLSYETPVTEDGGWLSGGERQKLALARLCLGRPRIAVLDEATHHLDEETEAFIDAQLAALGCTRIYLSSCRRHTDGAAMVGTLVDGHMHWSDTAKRDAASDSRE